MLQDTPAFTLDRGRCAELLASPETYGSIICAIADVAFGTDAIWGSDTEPPADPLTILTSLEEQFGIRLPEQSENRMNALLTGVLTDAFFQDPEAFSAISMALAGGDVGDIADTLMDSPTLSEVHWARFELGLWRDDEDPPLSGAVDAVLDGILQRDAEEESATGVDDEGDAMLDMMLSFNKQLRYCGLTPEILKSLGPE